VPLTLYNKYKGMCEPLLLGHTTPNFVGVVFRPTTVCGYAPRQRLDGSVNILTNHAVNKNKITVFGGTQMRPNLHRSGRRWAPHRSQPASSRSIAGPLRPPTSARDLARDGEQLQE
jgi:hypothetical protein